MDQIQLMRRHGIDIPEAAIQDFCRRNRIERLSLFGSYLRNDFGPESDLDVLVELEPGATPSFLVMTRLEAELGELIGRKVDLRTPQKLSRHFRGRVLRDREIQFDSGSRSAFALEPGDSPMRDKPQMRYFEREDTLYMLVAEGEESSSVEVSPKITAELDAEGQLIGRDPRCELISLGLHPRIGGGQGASIGSQKRRIAPHRHAIGHS